MQVKDYGDLQYLLAQNYSQNVRQMLSRAQDWNWRSNGVNVPDNGVSMPYALRPAAENLA